VKIREKHTIHKLTLDIHFENFDISQKWISTTQAETAEALRRTIERCLGGFDFSQNYVTITKLEFDLGVFRIEELLPEMPEMLYRELQKVLSSSHRHSDHLEHQVTIGTAGSHPFPVPQALKKKSNSFTKNSETDAFLFFLQHGHLPWWYADVPVWDQEWLLTLTRQDYRELQNFLLSSDNGDFHKPAAARLIYQFRDDFLTKLLKGLQLQEPVEKAWDWILRWHALLQTADMADLQTDGPLPSLSVIRQHFWIRWIKYTIGKSARPTLEAHLTFFNQSASITSILLGKDEHKLWLDRVPQFWQQELSLIQRGYRNELKVSYGFGKDIDSSRTQIAVHEALHSLSPLDKEDFIMTSNSGLVLLHPFLPQLFDTCKWLNKDELDITVQTRAVYALHYLATGEEDAPEFVLMLPKLLCGMSLGSPLEPIFPLTEEEKAECDEMLLQIIRHWAALRKTSPEGLRHTFLRREGKLMVTDQGWNLAVPRKTEDILLSRLPWGFSLLKLPWMRRLLAVSWE
jgi:hypothetical protein